jgi:GAF domain-containing protein
VANASAGLDPVLAIVGACGLVVSHLLSRITSLEEANERQAEETQQARRALQHWEWQYPVQLQELRTRVWLLEGGPAHGITRLEKLRDELTAMDLPPDDDLPDEVDRQVVATLRYFQSKGRNNTEEAFADRFGLYGGGATPSIAHAYIDETIKLLRAVNENRDSRSSSDSN